MKRPAGISVLALLFCANGVALAVQAALWSSPNAAVSNALLNIYPASWTDALGVAFPVIAAVCSLVAAAGLWFLREEARAGLLVVAAVPLAYYLAASALGSVLDPSRFAEDFTETMFLRGLVLGVMIVYLTRRHVKRAFGRRDQFFAEFDAAPEYDARVLLEYERQMEDEAVLR